MTRSSVGLGVVFLGFLLSVMHTAAADWSPKLAAQYLDGRQKEWFAWKPAMSANGPCVSCHTGMPYLMARPVLRRALNEPEPTEFERGYMVRLLTNVGEKKGALQDVETIFTALFLAERDRASRAIGPDTHKAFTGLWNLQATDGPVAGAWKWYTADLDPWEHRGSAVYGASLAALALGTAPGEVRANAATQAKALTAFLAGSLTPDKPLHDRLAILWASSRLTGTLAEAQRKALIAEVFAKQAADGGWAADALGPWMTHPDAPPRAGSGNYATAFTTFVLQTAGVPASTPGLVRARAWLSGRQDPATGAWPDVSMNKRRPEGSMEARFMQDAATAFASMALLEGSR
jgi:squalene-hopene/tetraprenyl-beta-curcumene cyclase